MGRRVGQLAGILAFALMIGRLGRLLTVGPDQPQWNLILTAAAVLGGIAWWLLGQMTSRSVIKVTIFGVAGLLLALRIMTPETLAAGVLPTGASWPVIGEHLELAFRVLRSGLPPVAASPGLLAILAVLMWVIGALFTWGSTGGPYAAMFVPSLVAYLQFAVFDRSQAGLGWMAVSGLVLALSAISMAMEHKGDTGRARDDEGRPMERKTVMLAVTTAGFLMVGAIALASNATLWVDEYGNAPWQGLGSGGYGDGPGGSSFDGLVDLQQRILNLTDEPVFTANFGEGAPDPSSVYWRVESLDQFDGVSWDRSDRGTDNIDPEGPVANLWDTYQGTTYDFSTNVLIAGLLSQVAPTPGVPVAIGEPPNTGNSRPASHFAVTSDSAIVAQPGLANEDSYQIRSLYPNLTADLGALATGDGFTLTPMFAAAAEAGDFPYLPERRPPATPPPDMAKYLVLPTLPSGIERLARAETLRATSDFERAFILEEFFRTTGDFTYSIEVSTGHGSLQLDDWLNDDTSQNYRTGYCEQFAAAMAVMARTLNIPSRVVWGFTPGSVETDQNGNEYVVVRHRNAHAWVEVWLEPVGWVTFDPTPRREGDAFPEQPASITAGLATEDYLPELSGEDATPPPVVGAPEFNPQEIEDAPTGAIATGPRWWLIGFLAVALLVSIIPIYKRLRRRRRLERVRNGDVTAAWDELIDRLADLGDPVSDTLTPMEVARTRDITLLPLAVSYAAAVYGGREGSARESDLFGAELWIDNHYDAGRRARAAMSLNSLLPRG
jgi:transglutaminase-like putative cysteine protease